MLLFGHMSNDDTDLALVWKALADPTRRTILDRLAVRPHTTGELAALFETSRFAVMKHLDVLERAGLVVVRREGRERWNALNGVPLQRIYERWMSPQAGRWASSLLALKRVSEGDVEDAERELQAMPETTTATPVTTMRVEMEVRIEASAERVWKALTNDLAAWWGAPYLIGEPDQVKTIAIEPAVGGRVYETWVDGTQQGGLWGIVTRILPQRQLEITGSIGMSGPVHGVVIYDLEPAGSGGQATVVKLSHRAIGEIGPETQA